LEGELSLLLNSFRITKSTTVPDSKRITVKLAASMVCSPKANRQKTEFAAKATSAKLVVNRLFAKELLALSITLILRVNITISHQQWRFFDAC